MMARGVSDTSRDALADIRASSGVADQRGRVELIVLQNWRAGVADMTVNEIKAVYRVQFKHLPGASDIESSSIAGRVNELKKQGRLVPTSSRLSRAGGAAKAMAVAVPAAVARARPAPSADYY